MSFEGLVPNAIFRGRVWGGMMGCGGSGLIDELIHQCVCNWMDKGRQQTLWKMELMVGKKSLVAWFRRVIFDSGIS